VSNVSIKTVKEVDALRVACQMASETLLKVGEMIRAGITTEDINRFVHEDTIREYRIDERGLTIGEPLEGFQGVLRGVPVYIGGGQPLLEEQTA